MYGKGVLFRQERDNAIDDISEVEAAVDDILNSQSVEESDGEQAPDATMVLIIREYLHRIRILTWAVVVIAIVLILKESK